MPKNCIYCKTTLEETSVVDVCHKCGLGVWGEKMFSAIIQNMENAREVGDLYQGSVSESKPAKERVIPFESQEPQAQPTEQLQPAPQSNALASIAQEAIAEQAKQEALGPESETLLSPEAKEPQLF